MDDLLTRLLTDYERGVISRRKLLRTLGMTAVGAPLAAALGTSAYGQGGCRDGYGQGRCMLTKEVATAPIKPVFASTGWKTVGLENIVFDVLDYKKEAAFYIALMGWKLRNDDGKQAIMDMGEWGSCIFRQAPASAFAAPTQNAGARGGGAGGGARGGRGGGNPVTATVKGFGFVIEPWNAKTVEAELKKRGIEPIADNDGK